MAKKGQAALQVDLTTEEEWDKFLEKDGLLLIDVYADWCGPCTAMQGILKKMKLERGGDFFQLATARADDIPAIQRFVTKSEPTWMFIAGQLVRMVWGANAPLLQNIILEELNNEKECLAGTRTRIENKVDTLSEEEQAEYDLKLQREEEANQLKQEKADKHLRERRLAQAKTILEALHHVGLVIVFPHCMKKASDVLDEAWKENGFAVWKKERPILQATIFEEIEYFSSYKIPEKSMANLTSGERSQVILVTKDKLLDGVTIDDTVRYIIYGQSGVPSGDPDSPGQKLAKILPPSEIIVKEPAEDNIETEPSEVEEPEPKVEELVLWGLWAPANDLVKATALMHCFPALTTAMILPEVAPIPPHIAMSFDAFKRCEILNLTTEFEKDVMAYGFFNNEDPQTAQLLANTINAYNKRTDAVYGEKLVLKVSKEKNDAVLALALLGPTFMSSNLIEGEKDCALFFPEGFSNEEIPDEEAAPRTGGKEKKKKDLGEATPSQPDADDVIIFEENIAGEGAIPELDDQEVIPIPADEITEGPNVDDKGTSIEE